MPTDMGDKGAATADERTGASRLRERAELALRIVALALALFVVADLAAESAWHPRRFAIRAVQSALLAATFVLNRRLQSDRRRTAILVGYTLTISAGLTVLGVDKQDYHAHAITAVALAFGTAATVPWGVLPQAVVTSAGALLFVLNVVLVRGLDDLALSGHVAVAVGVCQLVSIYVAQQVTRALAERDRAETMRERLFTLARDLIMVTGLNGTIERANPAWRRVLGFAPAEITGRTLLDLVVPAERAEAARQLALIGADQTADAIALRLHARDGTSRAVEWSIARSGDGCLYAVGRDVTERVLAEAEREKDARTSRALARAGRDLIAVVDTPALLERLCTVALEILRASHATSWLWSPADDAFVAAATAGAGDVRALGRVRLPRADCAELLALLEHEPVVVLDDAAPMPDTIRALRRAGGITLSVCFPLRRGRTIVGLQTVNYRDRTDAPDEDEARTVEGLAHLATMALSNAYLVEELERASRVKDEFVATMSHELRTPLNVIIGYTEMLGDDLEDPAHVGMLAQIRRASLELLDLVQTTLDLNRIAAGVDRPVFETVQLADVWRELRADYAPVEHGPVRLRWHVPPDAVLRTDARKLKQIMKNLIGNALKFTDAGEVVVGCRHDAAACVLTVHDTGIGIAPDEAPYVFEMFRQVDGSMTRRHGGVGIGLYLVKTFVDQLGGTVEIESTPGVGSTFTVTLPTRGGEESASMPDVVRHAAPAACRTTAASGESVVERAEEL